LLRRAIKRCAQGIAIVFAAPLALLSGFGRFRSLFLLGAHTFAVTPGVPGVYLRAAFYWMTLRRSELDVYLHFGAFFSHPEVELGKDVSIGPYTMIGRAVIGERTQIAGGVQIVSGTKQHLRDAAGKLTDEGRVFQALRIGAHCWIGAGAIIANDVGDRTTIGSGAVVVKPIPSDATAVGNPARVLEDPSPRTPADSRPRPTA